MWLERVLASGFVVCIRNGLSSIVSFLTNETLTFITYKRILRLVMANIAAEMYIQIVYLFYTTQKLFIAELRFCTFVYQSEISTISYVNILHYHIN